MKPHLTIDNLNQQMNNYIDVHAPQITQYAIQNNIDARTALTQIAYAFANGQTPLGVGGSSSSSAPSIMPGAPKAPPAKPKGRRHQLA